jgi:hypothetical protein
MKKSLVHLALGFAFLGLILQSCSEKTASSVEEKEVIEMETTSNLAKKDSQKVIIQNMQAAYKGEITAHFKYAAYSRKAAEDAHPEIALLFKAASAAELIHANNHKVVLIRMREKTPEIIPEFRVRSTTENLKEAIEG